MKKAAIAVAAGWVLIGSSLFGQGLFQDRGSFAALSLSNTGRFSYGSLPDWASDPILALPDLPLDTPRRPVSRRTLADSPKDLPELKQSMFDYVTGEVGFLYGSSTGHHRSTTEQGYITGAAGNDRFQITVGASYENWSGHGPRYSRW